MISLPRALFLLTAVTLLITGGGTLFFRQWLASEKKRKNTLITALVQTGPQKEMLTTSYLAELLDLSADHPKRRGEFDLKWAKNQLLASSVIKAAEVRWHSAGTLFIDYTVRQPLAWLADLENGAIDEAGYIFPVRPFFTPKNLPQIYLGFTAQGLGWNTQLKSKNLQLAFDLLKILSSPCYRDLFTVKCIDVSKADAQSFGQREIVLSLLDGQAHRFLRLTPKNYAQELGNYLQLRPQLLAEGKVIDLRLSHLAFIK